MRVVAAGRGRGAGVVEQLGKLPDVEVGTERLSLGDYRVDGRLLFERKTIRDLAVSIRDGRLFRQACRLAAGRYRPVYIIEGSGKDLSRMHMPRDAVQGALVTLTVVLGLPVLRSIDPAETARLIVYAAGQVGRAAAGGVYRPGRRSGSRRRRQLYILQGLPGIGPERAARLLDTFGSVESVLNADERSLGTVDGIGDKTAMAIRRIVSERRVGYGSQTVTQSSLPSS